MTKEQVDMKIEQSVESVMAVV